ncbi:FRAS1-related extracellular matrix protein 1-like, partial [Gouania willdenowi]|uniref:FRAS1-related extracellular matrix protein 1-like n=1 Tax=Gouania willdenowi TaxID=441366 RepID=UPI00105667EC
AGEAVLLVDEGSFACLSDGFLKASDLDSPTHQLTFHLQAPPLHGYLENTLPPVGSEWSSTGVPVESFSHTHLTSGYINYVQSEHKGVEQTRDKLSVIVSDGLHSSAPSTVHILISPTNDESPLLHFNNFTVEEGGIKDLTPTFLEASDLDVPADLLTFSVQRAPVHGRLVSAARHMDIRAELLRISLPLTTFTLQELRQGLRVLYVHDDTETLKDEVTVELTDGVHTAQRTTEVTVVALNDHEPTVEKNVGVYVDWLCNTLISDESLQSEDLDSDHVTYIITSGPQYGTLTLQGNSVSVGQSFSQDDVDMKRLSYRHTSASEGFKGHDSFRFTLSDSQHEVKGQSFHIRVNTEVKGELRLVSSHVFVGQGQRFVLSTDVLLADDSSNQPEQLLFSVRVPPQHGVLHNTHTPGVPITTFTQLDVTAQQVCYTHDNSHDSDNFSFLVSNGGSTRSGSMTFSIVLADQVPPTLLCNSALQLQSGSTATITSAHLQLSDPDSAPSNLTYLLTTPPRHGRLLLRGETLAPPTTHFTQSDVDELRLSYTHTRTHTHTDSFSFLPSDGINQGYLETGSLRAEPAEFVIQVQQEEWTPPSLSVRRTPSSVVPVGSGRWGIFITNRNLQTSNSSVEFIISRKPRVGHLENALTGSYIGGRFTQRDVDQRALVFIIPTNVNQTQDQFEFKLRDVSGRMSSPQRLSISWSIVQLSMSCYRTCETHTRLLIHLQRRGRSQDPAYVSIEVEEGGAKLGSDFTLSSGSLIQFDPGVNMKAWPVFPVKDVLEENVENFTVSLIKPQNAVLGAISSASVEILDSTGGRCNKPRPLSPSLSDVIDVEAELQWENRPHPRREDTPDRYPYQEHREGVEPEEQFHSVNRLGIQTYTEVPQNDHPGTQEVSSRCSEGWTHHRGRCYIVSFSMASWASAERTCKLLYSSSLPLIGSSRDVWWLWKFVGRKPFWTGSQCVLVVNVYHVTSTDCSSTDQHMVVCSSLS